VEICLSLQITKASDIASPSKDIKIDPILHNALIVKTNMASTICNETRLNRWGELKLKDTEWITRESPAKHFLRHSRGKVKLLQGENWFDICLLHGIFHEPLREHESMTAQTRIYFDVDAPHCIVKSWCGPQGTRCIFWAVTKIRSADVPKDLTLYEMILIPSPQMKYLKHNDHLHITFPEGWNLMITQGICLTYKKETVANVDMPLG